MPQIIIEGKSIINLIIEVIGIMVCLFSMLILIFGGRRARITTHYFYFCFFGLLSYYLSLLALEILRGVRNMQHGKGVVAAGFATFFTAVLTSYMVSNYMVHVLRRQRKTGMRLRYMLLAVFILQVGVLIYAQAAGKLALLNEAGEYLEGDWAAIGYSMVPMFMLLDVVILFVYGKGLRPGQKNAFFIYMGLPLLFSFIRLFTPGVYIVALSSACAMMILYIMTVSEQQREYEYQQRRAEQMKVDLMLSQIQPHFLFNALYVIQEICHDDPETASSAIRQFSLYLRHNMDSLTISRPIPFDQELEHVNHYIWLQQLRFGKALDIQFDLHCTDFLLPTLTLQPIVENAIRYGLRQKEDGEGTVVISSFEKAGSYEVIVEDNGPGFRTGNLPSDELTHVGLDNVRERLGRVCGGLLQVESVPGKGTRVTMVIPKGS